MPEHTPAGTAPDPSCQPSEISVATPSGPAGLVVTVARNASEWRQRLELLADDGADDAVVASLREKLDASDASCPTALDLAVLAEELTYAVYPVSFKLPRHSVIVGWLDSGGYRHANPACAVPGAEFLTTAWSLLNEPDPVAFLNRRGAFA